MSGCPSVAKVPGESVSRVRWVLVLPILPSRLAAYGGDVSGTAGARSVDARPWPPSYHKLQPSAGTVVTKKASAYSTKSSAARAEGTVP